MPVYRAQLGRLGARLEPTCDFFVPAASCPGQRRRPGFVISQLDRRTMCQQPHHHVPRERRSELLGIPVLGPVEVRISLEQGLESRHVTIAGGGHRVPDIAPTARPRSVGLFEGQRRWSNHGSIMLPAPAARALHERRRAGRADRPNGPSSLTSRSLRGDVHTRRHSYRRPSCQLVPAPCQPVSHAARRRECR